MKKLTLAACAAAACACAFAGDAITSKNIVGYQTKAMASNWYIDTVNTFVNADGSDATLGKFSFTPVTGMIKPGNFQVILTGADGNPMKVGANKWIAETYPEAVTDYGTKDVIFVYIPADGEDPAKWVLSADKKACKYDMSDCPFAAGEGFTLAIGSSLADGVNVTYSGQVLDEDIPFFIPSGTYMNTGNAAPKDFALGDFVFQPVTGMVKPGNLQVILTGQDGNPMKVKDNAWIVANYPDAVTDYGEKDVIFVFIPADGEDPAKWVLSADKKACKYDVTGYQFKAGDGFCVAVGSSLADGVTVQLPNALN